MDLINSSVYYNLLANSISISNKYNFRYQFKGGQHEDDNGISLKGLQDYQNEVLNEFGGLLEHLRKSEIPIASLEALLTYAKRYEQTIRFSARYFELKRSVTVIPDFVAIDVKNGLIASNGAKIKVSMLPNGSKIVRRIDRDRYNVKMVKILSLFLDTPHVLPTLGIARYTNKKGRDILVSYHPFFDMDLFTLLIECDYLLNYKTQVAICCQIILGMEKIHEKGIHGDLYLRNILMNKDCHVVISDLEMFKPYDASEEEWGWPIQADWSAPEVRTASYPPPASAIHDVWSLGLIFHSLFQMKNRQQRYFRGSTQEEISADIMARNFPVQIAQMIYSMLQIDPAKRFSLKEVSEYFQKEILLKEALIDLETSSEVAST